MTFKRIIGASAAIATLGLFTSGLSAQAAVPTPGMTYSFNNTLVDSSSASTLTPAGICSSPATEDLCNLTEQFGSDANGNYWAWTTNQGNGGGIVLTTAAPLGGTYSFLMKFSISGQSADEDPEKYTKLIDFKNLTTDDGLYFHGTGPSTLWSANGESYRTFDFNEVLTLAVVRDDAGTVTIYVAGTDGNLETVATIDDSSSTAFIAEGHDAGSIIRLFQEEPEDVGQSHEGAPGGKLYGFEGWPGVALTEEQVSEAIASLGSTAAPSDPSLATTGVDASATGMLAGAGALALAAGALAIARARRERA